MNKSLAMKTFDAMGTVGFLEHVKSLSSDQAIYFFSDSKIVCSMSVFDPKETYIEIIWDLGCENVINASYVYDKGTFDISRGRSNVELFNIGKVGPELSQLDAGTRFEVWAHDGRVFQGMGFKSVISDLWEVTGRGDKLDDSEMEELINRSDNEFKFFDVDGEEVEL